MSARLYGNKKDKIFQLDLKKTKRIMPYHVLCLRMPLHNGILPYPIPMYVLAKQLANNKLHDAVLAKDVSVLETIDKAELFDLMRATAYQNTPFNLAIKLGDWTIVNALIELMEKELTKEERDVIFQERDSMGLMPLSYALFLRAPFDVIKTTLEHTPKRAYYSDPMYDLSIKGLDEDEEKSAFVVTEAGYKSKDSEGGFSIYEQTPMELYFEELPSQLTVSKEITEKEPFHIGTEGGKLSFHQVLRNLVFPVPELCENRGLKPKIPDSEIPRSSDQHLFDVTHNFKPFAESRNADFDPKVQCLLSSWCENTLGEDWVVPTEEELAAKVASESEFRV